MVDGLKGDEIDRAATAVVPPRRCKFRKLGDGTMPIDHAAGEDAAMPIDRTDADAMPSDGGGGYA